MQKYQDRQAVSETLTGDVVYDALQQRVYSPTIAIGIRIRDAHRVDSGNGSRQIILHLSWVDGTLCERCFAFRRNENQRDGFLCEYIWQGSMVSALADVVDHKKADIGIVFACLLCTATGCTAGGTNVFLHCEGTHPTFP
jgi:hypothetical protein